MEENKISAIKKLESIRKEIITSNYHNFPKKLLYLENAYQIALNAPFRETIRVDGVKIYNHRERQHLLKMFQSEIDYLQTLKIDQFDFWKFQVIGTIVMLMISISDEGLDEIDSILKK